VFEEKLAGVQSFRFKGQAVGRDESPMTDFAAQQFYETKRRKILANSHVGKIGGLGENEPDPIVFRLFWTFAQHEHDLLSNINSETGKHRPHFGLERSESFEDKREGGRSALRLVQPGDSMASGHSARIARKNPRIRRAVRVGCGLKRESFFSTWSQLAM
jgi:hypothetical protein